MSDYIQQGLLPFRYNRAGVIPVNTIIFDWDTAGLNCPILALHLTSLGATGVLTPEFSSNDVDWSAGWVEPINLANPASASVNAAGLYLIPRLSRFIRLRVSTATTGGTTTLSVTESYSAFRSGTSPSALTGPAAHDAVISGNPLRLAGRAINANYAAVANGDVADLVTTLVGALVQKPFSIPEADWQFASAAGGIVNTTDVVAAAARAAGIRNYVTAIQLRNANAVATEFVIKDGSTVIWRTQLPANMTGSMEVEFPTPVRGAAATAINLQCVTTGAAVYANVQGYQAP